VESAYAIDTITLAEGLLELPAELKNRHLKEGSMLIGIQAGSPLYKIFDSRYRVSYPPPTDGVILSNAMAKDLQVDVGDTIYIASPLLADDVPVVVTRIIEQMLGGGFYMELGALSELMGLANHTATAIILNTSDLSYVKEHLKNAANITAIDDKDSTLRKYREMMDMYSSMYLIMQIMSAMVGFAIIYTPSTISLSERKREYATLRVVGLSTDEVADIMNFEYWILGVVGMALGVPFVGWLNAGLNAMMETTGFTMPSVLPASAYTTGVVGSAAAILVAGYLAKGKIRKFDMVEVLKERE
jgi:putative ABC transport system permease protein